MCFRAIGEVDREQGVLSNVAVVTEGEAKGHGVNLDAEFVGKVVADGNAAGARGLKARFGHPTMSSTALGTFLGRYKNFREESADGRAIARADLFLSGNAKETPQGNLFDYVTGLASEDPSAFGASIVFKPGARYLRRDGEKKYIGGDVQPERGEPVFVDCEELVACDLVDDPAANPDGLFSQWSRATWAGQVTEFLDLHPHIFDLFEENPDVMRGFLVRYREYLARKGKSMATDLESAAETALDQGTEAEEAEALDVDPGDTSEEVDTEAASAEADGETVEANTGETPDAEATGEGETADDAGEPAPEATDAIDPEADTDVLPPSDSPQEQGSKTDGERFLEAFGDVGGVWFAKGLTFEQAQAAYVAKLKEENGELRSRLEALDADGEDPLSFATAPTAPAGDFVSQAKAKAEAEEITFSKAASLLAKENPKLHAEYKRSARESE